MGKPRNYSLVLPLCLGLSLAWSNQAALAFPYEVMQTDTFAREAATLQRSNRGQIKSRAGWLRGKIVNQGTESTVESNVLVQELRVMQQLAIASRLTLRLSTDTFLRYEKETSDDQYQLVGESSQFETQLRLDLVYATENNLDVILGGDAFYVRNFDIERKMTALTAKDAFHSAFFSRPHLAVVKHGSNFDAGISYQFGIEKNRSVTKSNNLDNTSLKLQDVLFEPATVSIFLRKNVLSGSIYGEFAAIEASGGGNKTASGGRSQEDYFRIQLAAAIPMASQSLVFEPALSYKSISYADNRNVTLPTIPSLALHMDVNFDKSGFPLFLGVFFIRGTDGQSLPEFNAKYELLGYGANLGLNWGF